MDRRLRDPVHVHQQRLLLRMPLVPGFECAYLERLPTENHAPQSMPGRAARLSQLNCMKALGVWFSTDTFSRHTNA